MNAVYYWIISSALLIVFLFVYSGLFWFPLVLLLFPSMVLFLLKSKAGFYLCLGCMGLMAIIIAPLAVFGVSYVFGIFSLGQLVTAFTIWKSKPVFETEIRQKWPLIEILFPKRNNKPIQ